MLFRRRANSWFQFPLTHTLHDFISDAMAERGDLIGCEVLLEMAEYGEVPISFTLNGKPITQARVSISIFQEDSLLFPFVSMGHEGVAVSAKVSNMLSLFLKQSFFRLKLSGFVWGHDDKFPLNLTISIPSSLFFASVVVVDREAAKERGWGRDCKLNAPAKGVLPLAYERRVSTPETCLDIIQASYYIPKHDNGFWR